MQAHNNQICELYSSYYEFDSHDLPCWFNEEKEKVDKLRMLELLGKLNARIAELNDGSFVVDDQETPHVYSLEINACRLRSSLEPAYQIRGLLGYSLSFK